MKPSNTYQLGRFRLSLLLLLLVFLSVAAYGLFQLSRSTEFQLFGKLVDQVDTKQKVVALTFDDGPTTLGTKPTLEILKQHDVKGTFFLNGQGVMARPKIVKQLIEDGHELGNHSYSHARMIFMSYTKVADEVERTTRAIRQLGYQAEIHFRPPYGKKLWMLPYYLNKNKITTIMWDVAPEHFSKVKDSPEAISQRTLNSVKPGSIILLHPKYGDGATLEALPEIIMQLKNRGYRFVTVSELLSISAKSAAKT